MTIAIGVDGCKGGWICCLLDTETRQIDVRLELEFSNIVLSTPVGSIIAVDVPIGLSDDYSGRTCDSLLGGHPNPATCGHLKSGHSE